jgi:hypothetical protein
VSTFKEGMIIRKRDIENAQKLRQAHETELAQLKKEEKGLKTSVSKLKGKLVIGNLFTKPKEDNKKQNKTRICDLDKSSVLMSV